MDELVHHLGQVHRQQGGQIVGPDRDALVDAQRFGEGVQGQQGGHHVAQHGGEEQLGGGPAEEEQPRRTGRENQELGGNGHLQGSAWEF